MNYSNYIRNIPDFPKSGILFKDITPLLSEPQAFADAIQKMSSFCNLVNAQKIIGIESRGFIFGVGIAQKLQLPFVPIRKAGKLPFKTHSAKYQLEYGSDSIEMHTDAIVAGEKVVIVDDLLATGGTAEAAGRLVEVAGGKIVGLSFFIELVELGGRAKLEGYQVDSLVSG